MARVSLMSMPAANATVPCPFIGNAMLGSSVATAGSQLGHAAAAVVRHPEVGSVEGHPERDGTRGEGPEARPVGGPELGHGVAALVRHPDVGSVESHATRGGTHGEGPQARPVG